MYPEWIQEQLDKMSPPPSRPAPQPVRAQAFEERLRVRIGIMEARIIHVLSQRLDRIEAKLDRLLTYCEGE